MKLRLISDDTIKHRYGRRHYGLLPPGSSMYELERKVNDTREAWAVVLVDFARLLRKLPFVS